MTTILGNKNRISNWFPLVLGIFGGLAVGWMVVRGDFLWLGIVGLAVVLALCLLHPVLAASLVLGFAFINPSLLPPVMEVGEFTFRYCDGAILLLAVVIFLRLAIQQRKFIGREWWIIFKPLFPFLAYVGISLVFVWIYVPDALVTSFASYARLMVTVLSGLLIYMTFRRERDVRFFTRVILIFAVASMGIGIWEVLNLPLRGRHGGLLGINTFGLVAGLLVLWAVIAHTSKRPVLPWAIPLAAGILGLFLSKSGSSTLATILSILFFWIVFRRRHKSVQGTWPLRLVLGGLVGIALAIWALWLLRPSDFAGLVSLSGGSWAQRLMIAYSALRIFFSHPIFGVGWQASGTQAIIGDPDLNEALMQAFPKLPEHYLFLERPTSLHNLYLQLLAELGTIGFSLFIYGVIRVGITVTGILKQIPYNSPFKQFALFNAMALVYLLIWWNTNPLFGGQTESILAITFLSLLAALWRLQRQSYRREKFAGFEVPLAKNGMFQHDRC